MSGEDHGVRTRRTAPGLPVLSMDVRRMLDIHAWQPVRTSFSYDPDAPLTVTVQFAVDGGPRVTWRIGRDLLYQGLFSPSGLDDVRIRPAHLENRGTAFLRLASRDMAALFELPVPPLEAWLEHTYELVPAGKETDRLGWDDFVANVLDTSHSSPS
ncbi:Sporulation-specific cell division protein SsgB [Streptomyces sp. RB5]|uniref:Sporulation-specific cell division protein SsgB n=1 Tax=Streptomyces smaragdinus TaxID=2585196 RepID=A0A7K0CC12_9ACTN|nr:SsgA family sporulation/cell division regulator [Streptomyces smaragdinus]MQY10943.1 Sporulation-specific cell division protein SsgB [Streptomyces smaragdinus]